MCLRLNSIGRGWKKTDWYRNSRSVKVNIHWSLTDSYICIVYMDSHILSVKG